MPANYRTITTPIFEPNQRNSTALTLNPQFLSLFKLYNGAVIKHLQRRGWLSYFNWAMFIDEWTSQDPFTVEVVVAMAKLFKGLHPKIRLLGVGFPARRGVPPFIPPPARPELIEELVGLVDAWMVDREYSDPGTAARLSQLRRERNVQSYIYGNGMHIVDLPWIRGRSFPWQVWRSGYQADAAKPEPLGLSGSLVQDTVTGWCVAKGCKARKGEHVVPNPWDGANLNPPCQESWPKNLLRGVCPANAGGAEFLLYPPRSGDPSDPAVSSIRWELVAKGLADAEYFVALQRLRRGLARCYADGATELAGIIASSNAALDAVGSVVWGFTYPQYTDQHWSGPGAVYADNTTRMHEVLDGVAAQIGAASAALRACAP